jgi:hypothetical protein
MPIPSGTWQITAGTQVGTLTFNSLTGAVTGTLLGTTPFVGFFDETAQTLTLYANPQVTTEGAFSDVLGTPFTVYQGSLFPPFTAPTPPPAKQIHVLAGVSFSVNGTNAPVYTTWYAQNPAPVKTGKEGKDVGKDHKDHKDKEKEVKETLIKESFVEKLPEVSASGATSFGLPDGDPASEPGSAIGRSFIDPEERPAVGEAAVREPPQG